MQLPQRANTHILWEVLNHPSPSLWKRGPLKLPLLRRGLGGFDFFIVWWVAASLNYQFVTISWNNFILNRQKLPWRKNQTEQEIFIDLWCWLELVWSVAWAIHSSVLHQTLEYQNIIRPLSPQKSACNVISREWRKSPSCPTVLWGTVWCATPPQTGPIKSFW